MYKKYFIAVFFLSAVMLLFASCDSESSTNPEDSTGLTASPSSVTITEGQQTTIQISGGTAPEDYSASSDNVNITTVQITGSTLSIEAKSEGSATVRVDDNNSTSYVDIPVTVISASQSGASLSFSITGDTTFAFNASGDWDTSYTQTSGCGYDTAYFSSTYSMYIEAYQKTAEGRAHTILIFLQNTSPISIGEYNVTSTSDKKATIGVYPDAELHPTGAQQTYSFTTGSVTITDYYGNTIEGTFTGSGHYFYDGSPDMSRTVTLSNGVFKVNKEH